MRGFLVGAVVGLAIGVGAMWWLRPEAREAPGPLNPDPIAAEPEPARPPPPVLEAPSMPEAVEPGKPFPKGEAILRIGDGFVFGERHARAVGENVEAVDLICQDIRYGASLECPHGAASVATPFARQSDKLTSRLVFDHLLDAPLEMPARRVHAEHVLRGALSGIALVKASDGVVYKVLCTELHGNPHAFKRWVRIRYAPVEAKDGGGIVNLPGEPRVVLAGKAGIPKAIADYPKVPGDSFRSFLKSPTGVIKNLPDKLAFKSRQSLALAEPLRTEIEFKAYSSLIAPHGIERNGKVAIRSYAGVGVIGEMAGTIDVRSYGYLHIHGDLTGTVNCQSYATVIVDGDVLGTLKLRSYVKLYVRGRLRDPARNLDVEGSCWSTFFFDGYYSRAEIEQMPGDNSVTLHVRDSDLEVGTTHRKIGTWREVIVGDKAWKKLP